jgi:hypothetical protein
MKEKELLCFKGRDLQCLYNVSKRDNERLGQSSGPCTDGIFLTCMCTLNTLTHVQMGPMGSLHSVCFFKLLREWLFHFLT